MSRRKLWIGLGVAALITAALAVGGWAMRDQFAYAEIATGYAAKTTCSCVHVSGRNLEACVADFPEDSRDQINVAQDGDRVRASVLMGAISAEAIYEGEFGCRIVN